MRKTKPYYEPYFFGSIGMAGFAMNVVGLFIAPSMSWVFLNLICMIFSAWVMLQYCIEGILKHINYFKKNNYQTTPMGNAEDKQLLNG